MKPISFFMICAGSLLATAASTLASPLQPWDNYTCSQIRQPDGRQIGGVCYNFDVDMQVDVVNVYYFGELYQNDAQYSGYYANLQIDGFNFSQKGLKKETYGDGNNLPKQQVLHAKFVVSTSFSYSDLKGRNYAVYFQAEQKKPTHSPPFEFDNLFGSNYHGQIGEKDL